MPLYDAPGDRISGNLSLIINQYRDEREQYWSDIPEELPLIKMCDLMAEALLSTTADLVFDADPDDAWKKPRAPWAEITRMASERGFAEHLAESVEMCITDSAVDGCGEATWRCLELTTHSFGPSR